jgi:hypothetical protein
LYTTALHSTALHCTALHCTALHCREREERRKRAMQAKQPASVQGNVTVQPSLEPAIPCAIGSSKPAPAAAVAVPAPPRAGALPAEPEPAGDLAYQSTLLHMRVVGE